MKILLIGPFPLPIDGCSFANQTLHKNMVANGQSCDFINTNTSIVSSSQGNKFSFKKSISFLPVYFKGIKVRQSDIVYLTPGQTFFGILKYAPFILICRLFRKPYVIHLHGNYLGYQYEQLKGLKRRIFHFLISNASAGIVLSKSLTKNFHALIDPNKVFIVENFVSADFYKVEAQEKKRKDKLRILYLSNLMREKGILELLKALVALDKRGIDFSLVVAGKIEFEIEAEVNKFFKKLGNKAEFVGVVTGEIKQQKLYQANIFVLPTYYKMEGQPISLLEGLATGNIIITTKHAGIPDVVNRQHGFLLTPKSIEEIENTLIDINDKLGHYIDLFSLSNSQYARKKFNENVFYDKVLSVLNLVNDNQL